MPSTSGLAGLLKRLEGFFSERANESPEKAMFYREIRMALAVDCVQVEVVLRGDVEIGDKLMLADGSTVTVASTTDQRLGFMVESQGCVYRHMFDATVIRVI